MNVRSGSRRVLAWVVAMGMCTAAANAGLIHRFSFNDAAVNGKVKDAVGKETATLKGSASIADGKLVIKNDVAAVNDDKLAHLAFDQDVLPKEGSASIVFWFTASEVADYSRLLDVGDTQNGEGSAFIYVSPRTAEVQARAAITATDVSGRLFVDSAALDDNKPHMMAVVIDGVAKKMHVFVDGKEPSPAIDLEGNTLDKIKRTHTYVGRSSFEADPGLSASIDEIRVYDNALTLDEAAAMFKAGANALPPSTQPAKP